MKFLRSSRIAWAALCAVPVLGAACGIDHAPDGLRRTPLGPGATIRYDLTHKPLPDIPLPIDTATWPDPTSRTGLRINASLVAPTHIEQQARERFSQMEGWGTFSPITVSFDVDRSDPAYADVDAALDLQNMMRRHKGDDYEFSDDAVYLVNLTTGVPVPLDLGAGNFDYTLKKLDAYWPNDTRASERNLLFDTIDETRGGAVTRATFKPADDTDFDGFLDVPNLEDPRACPGPDAHCDVAADPAYASDSCLATRRTRDKCIADHLLTWYERETDTLIMRPILPLDEMTRYAVVVTDRTLDGAGHPVKSPFDLVYHAAQESTAQRLKEVIDDPEHRAYFGDIAGTGLDHVAFTFGFTTQPTVDDMKRLRDGLYGQGPFARWADQYPAELEVQRLVGLYAGVASGVAEDPNWASTQAAHDANCDPQKGDLYVVKYEQIREAMRDIVVSSFGYSEGPEVELLLKSFDSIDHFVIGTYKSPFLLEGGPKGTDPNAAFDLNYVTGEGEEDSDTVPFFMVVPKETAEHKQPFDVDIYGHGYTGNFTEMLLYAGNMAQHGLATVGINAVGHGLVLDTATSAVASSLLGNSCIGPMFDALTISRARDLNQDGIPDSGADFWSSYLFHTRDGVRQSVLDHIQLVRILRAFGTSGGQMDCRSAATGWANATTQPCDVKNTGKPSVFGDFDGDGKPDVGGPTASFGTWGESLGGVLSGIHGAIDPYVSSAVPGSGGAGLTDIGIRSFQGGVVEAVLLRLWGPLLVTVPASERTSCTVANDEGSHCTVCSPDQISLRWVMPDLNGTGELEIQCLSLDEVKGRTWFAYDLDDHEVKCATPSADGRLRIGVPASIGDRVTIVAYDGEHMVTDYASCTSLLPETTAPALTIDKFGPGYLGSGATNATDQICEAKSCRSFQGNYFGEGDGLVAPAEGYGQIRQTPELRRFIQLAQAALEPGDPASFAPYYSIKPMTDPSGAVISPHALLTLNTIGDMNVPLNSGIAFARAAGALPFMRPDQASRYPEYADYVTPSGLFSALGKTPNRVLVDDHVIEGIAPLARHPAAAACATSQNAAPPGASLTTRDGTKMECYPKGCASGDQPCWAANTTCDAASDRCVPTPLGQQTCDEALFDVDDLDEGTDLYFEQAASTPLRMARYTQKATAKDLDATWAPRLAGVPHGADGAWKADANRPLTALLDAYIVPQGVHTFTNGNPCQSFDAGTYLTNLTARFFMTRGTDLYYLSHPSTHLCLGRDVRSCGYLDK